MANPKCTAIGRHGICFHLFAGDEPTFSQKTHYQSIVVRSKFTSEKNANIRAGMEVGLWNAVHKRWVKMRDADMRLSPKTDTPDMPKHWDSERFLLIQYNGGNEFALYNKRHKRYVRAPRIHKSMDTTDQHALPNMPTSQIVMPDGWGWERFRFVNKCGGNYALECARSLGGKTYMRAQDNLDIGAGHAVHNDGQYKGWEIFKVVELPPPG